MNSVKIRQFKQRDTDIVIQLANDFASFDGPTTEEDLKVTHAFPEGFIVAEENGKVVSVINLARDVTDKKIAEQRLKESEKKYRHLFESSPYSIILINRKPCYDNNFVAFLIEITTGRNCLIKRLECVIVSIKHQWSISC